MQHTVTKCTLAIEIQFEILHATFSECTPAILLGYLCTRVCVCVCVCVCARARARVCINFFLLSWLLFLLRLFLSSPRVLSLALSFSLSLSLSLSLSHPRTLARTHARARAHTHTHTHTHTYKHTYTHSAVHPPQAHHKP